MDFDLPDDLAAFQDMLARFVERELIAAEPELDEAGALPPPRREALRKTAREAGLWLLDVSAEHGGAGLGALGLSIFWEEISRTITVPARDHTIFGPAVGPILLSLKGELAERYLLPVLAEEKVVCFAQTEPDAGADPRAMRTTAVRDGDNYVVNGTKRFITGADKADFAQVMVRTSAPDGGRPRVTCLLVDMDAPGVRLGATHRTMMGDAPSEIVFTDACVPVANRVGAEGDGFRLAQGWINLGRIRHGARACGVARRCIDMTAAYASQRRTFGELLASRQALQWALADSATALHATRLMVRDAAWRLDRDEDIRPQSYMVKLLAIMHFANARRIALGLSPSKGGGCDGYFCADV